MNTENIKNTTPKGINEMRYGYDENDEVVNEEITFTVKCTMRKRWAPQLVSMLKSMQHLGEIGSSRIAAIYADGDGDFRPKFEIDHDFPEVAPVEENDGNTLYDAG